ELHRLESIVKHFLSLAGPSSMDLHPLQAAKVIGHVCALLRPEAAARGIDIVMRLPDDLPPVAADSAQLTQALLNLLINAIQAVGRDGRVEVMAGTDRRPAMMSIEVRDTGPGVPA